jgi:hypothetical protein
MLQPELREQLDDEAARLDRSRSWAARLRQLRILRRWIYLMALAQR